LKILIVLNYRKNKSGITEQVLYLEKYFKEENLDVEMVSTFGNIIERIKGIVNVFRKGAKCDLIIGTGCSYFGFYPIFAAAAAAFFLNKKIIFNYHGGQADKFIGKYAYFLNNIFGRKKIITASDYLHKIFLKYGYNAVKIDNVFDFEEFPEAEKNDTRKINVVWARSFEPLYQPELALSAAKKITSEFDCEFHFYGNGSMLSECRRKFESPKIIFYGLKERKELLKSFGRYSVYLNTTLNDNIPNTIIEAGFYRLLVVSSEAGGIGTEFDENEILFVKENNLKSYTELLSGVLKNINEYDRIRDNLKKKIMKYSWSNVREKWLNIINEEKGNRV
jgi:glycosyltransferase involved in cell wall biosynthesis